MCCVLLVEHDETTVMVDSCCVGEGLLHVCLSVHLLHAGGHVGPVLGRPCFRASVVKPSCNRPCVET